MFVPTHELFSRADNATSVMDSQRGVVLAWVVLQLAGQISLLLLLVTYLFSRRLKMQRHPFVVNFVVTWFISTFPALLLLYAKQQESVYPTFNICLFNAALIAGVPPMVAVAFFAVIIQVWDMLRITLEGRPLSHRPLLNAFLITAPYLAFIAFSAATGVIGFNDPAAVTRTEDVVYCAVGNHHIAEVVYGFAGLMVIVTLCVQGWIMVMLRRNWRQMRGKKVNSSGKDFDHQLVIRAAAFTIYELFIVSFSLILIFDEKATAPKLMQAAAPLSVFVILASQKDVICSWIFCCRAEVDDTDVPAPVPEKSMISKPTPHSEGAVSIIEALEEMSFPAAETNAHAPSRPSNFDATRAAFRSPPPAPGRAVVYSARRPAPTFGHTPSASLSSLGSSSSTRTLQHLRGGSIAGGYSPSNGRGAMVEGHLRGAGMLRPGPPSDFGTSSFSESGSVSSYGSERSLLAEASAAGFCVGRSMGEESPISGATPRSAYGLALSSPRVGTPRSAGSRAGGDFRGMDNRL